MIKIALLSLAVAAVVLLAWKNTKGHQAPLPSIYATTTAGGGATCYANGKSWAARVDGTTINCYAADMPKD